MYDFRKRIQFSLRSKQHKEPIDPVLKNYTVKRLSWQQILKALIGPGKELSPGYGMVFLDLETDQSISGVREGENDISITVKRRNELDTSEVIR